VRFSWDLEKAASNIAKHGVSFEEAQEAVLDEFARSMPDPDHDDGRERVLGRSSRSVLFVVILENAADHIRIISARKATRRERTQYEEGIEDE
jgi:uncharacterized DUF497 family protein